MSMSERGGYSPPEAQEEKPEGEGKALKIDRIAIRRSAFSGPERSPESLTSGDANKPKQQGMGDDSNQKNDSTTTNSKTQGDENAGNQQQPGDQTNQAKPADDPAQEQEKIDA